MPSVHCTVYTPVDVAACLASRVCERNWKRSAADIRGDVTILSLGRRTVRLRPSRGVGAWIATLFVKARFVIVVGFGRLEPCCRVRGKELVCLCERNLWNQVRTRTAYVLSVELSHLLFAPRYTHMS